MDLPLHVLIISSVIKILIVVHVLLIGVMAMILAERKVSGWIQDRHGPNRVGPWGILQPIADGIKFLLKEDLIPDHVDKPIYVLAPAILLVPALIICAVVPFGSSITVAGYEIPLQIADINIGILYVLAITSLGVYGVVLGAWASNNKYSLLGGLRSSAQMISYELTLGLAIIGVLMLSGSLSLARDCHSARCQYLELELPDSSPRVPRVHDRGICGNQPVALRPRRSRTGACRRIPHRI